MWYSYSKVLDFSMTPRKPLSAFEGRFKRQLRRHKLGRK